MHQAIAAGDLYQVNYTAPLHGEFSGDAQTLFRRLHRAQPQGYAAFIDTGFEQVLSVSPELFFDWQNGQAIQGGQLLTRPMKGTAPRGSSRRGRCHAGRRAGGLAQRARRERDDCRFAAQRRVAHRAAA